MFVLLLVFLIFILKEKNIYLLLYWTKIDVQWMSRVKVVNNNNNDNNNINNDNNKKILSGGIMGN